MALFFIYGVFNLKAHDLIMLLIGLHLSINKFSAKEYPPDDKTLR
jgi:hypothetical protein